MSSFLIPVLIAVAVLALVAAGVWAYRRYNDTSSGRDDRYTPERILTPEQVSMLDYLHDTFPGQVVLPQVQAQKHAVDPPRQRPQAGAQQRLEQLVDYVVCGEDGRPMFAFDIEQFHLSNAKAKSHQVKLKNRVLKTAGVRFLLPEERHPPHAFARRVPQATGSGRPAPAQTPKRRVRRQQSTKACVSSWNPSFQSLTSCPPPPASANPR